jgi:hypothetical protein
MADTEASYFGTFQATCPRHRDEDPLPASEKDAARTRPMGKNDRAEIHRTEPEYTWRGKGIPEEQNSTPASLQKAKSCSDVFPKQCLGRFFTVKTA